MSKVVVTMVTLNREHVDAVLGDFDFVAEIKRYGRGHKLV